MSAYDHVGAPNAAEKSEMGLAPCVVCKQWSDEAKGEPQPYGEMVCDGCMREVIECPRCKEWFRRADFVAPDKIDDVCGDCAYQRDNEVDQ